MQLVIAGAFWLYLTKFAVELHNNTWKEVREALRKAEKNQHG